MNAKIFNQSIELIASTEAHLVGTKLHDWKVFCYIQKLILFPLQFLWMGVKAKIGGFLIWALIAFPFVSVVFLISKNLARSELTDFLLGASELYAALLVIFALPSMFGHSNVVEADVNFVSQHLTLQKASEKNIEFIKKNIKSIEERARARVTAFKWFVGLLWAGFIYFSTQFVEFLKAGNQPTTQSMMQVGWLFVSVVVGYFVVWGYEAATDKLFKAIEFGCDDYLFEIQLTAQQSIANSSPAQSQPP